MKPAYLRAFAALLLCSMLLGCPRRTEVWVSGATVEDLDFEFGTRRNWRRAIDVAYLRVDACEVLRAARGETPPVTRAVWVLEGAGPLKSLRYGQVPDGYEELQPAAPLERGCYVVEIDGTGQTGFTVGPLHEVTEMTDAQLAGVFRQ